MKKHELSILIPTYNNDCSLLVSSLQRLAEQAVGTVYEIIVAEDGSTDQATVSRNEAAVTALPHCRHLKRTENVGRAAIRNMLAREAQYEWLLFVDSDMTVTDELFLERYFNVDVDVNVSPNLNPNNPNHPNPSPPIKVIDGGVSIGGNPDELKGNLRYLYEKTAEQEHTAEQRQKRPYQHIHTANLMVSREVMMNCPFDERFHRYGYEDVLLGKQLRQQGVRILHIDNPLSFCTFEDNRSFVEKTEEGLQTLYEFREDLRGYSGLLTLVDGIHVKGVKWLLRLLFKVFKRPMRHNLCGNHPRLNVFKLYKLGYYLTINK